MCDPASKADASIRVFSDDVCVDGTKVEQAVIPGRVGEQPIAGQMPPVDAFRRVYADEPAYYPGTPAPFADGATIAQAFPWVMEEWDLAQVGTSAELNAPVYRVWRKTGRMANGMRGDTFEAYTIAKDGEIAEINSRQYSPGATYANPALATSLSQLDSETIPQLPPIIAAVCSDTTINNYIRRYQKLSVLKTIAPPEAVCGVRDLLTGTTYVFNDIDAGTSTTPITLNDITNAVLACYNSSSQVDGIWTSQYPCYSYNTACLAYTYSGTFASWIPCINL